MGRWVDDGSFSARARMPEWASRAARGVGSRGSSNPTHLDVAPRIVPDIRRVMLEDLPHAQRRKVRIGCGREVRWAWWMTVDDT